MKSAFKSAYKQYVSLQSEPADYSGGLPIKVRFDGEKYYTDFDVTSRKITPTNIYYLDSSYSGTETGSESQPFNDLKAAIDAANAAGQPAEFRVRGKFDRLRSVGTSRPQVSCNWVSWDGDTYSFSAEDPDGQTYTKTGGFTNVYQRTRSVSDFVIDYSVTDQYGFPTKYSTQTSIADVDANAGSYYFDSGSNVMYIHALDSRDMTVDDTDIMIVLKVNGLSFQPTGSEQMYIEDLNVIGHQSGFVELNGAAANTSKVTYNRVRGKYGSVTNGFVINDIPDFMAFDCYAGYAWRDGFNYHDNDGVGMSAVEVNCIAEYNGVEGGDSQNGSSIHDGMQILQIGGDYRFNAGRNIHHIGTGSVALLYGVRSSNSQAATSTGSINYMAGDTTDNTKMYLYGCSGVNSLVQVKASTGATVYVNNSLFDDPTNVADGSIVSIKTI